MDIKITKQIKVNTTIDSKDMGVAFAVATQEEQVDFIVAVVKEFKSWHGLDTDTQMARICDGILQSEHRQEIEGFMKLMMDYYNYCKSIRNDKTEVTNCETCRFYNKELYWCSRLNDTTYKPNCSSYKAIE